MYLYTFRGYINNKVVNLTTGDHFNQPGHSLANLKVSILEQIRIEDDSYRREREKYFINKFNNTGILLPRNLTKHFKDVIGHPFLPMV